MCTTFVTRHGAHKATSSDSVSEGLKPLGLGTTESSCISLDEKSKGKKDLWVQGPFDTHFG